jgi:hypothetical protein
MGGEPHRDDLLCARDAPAARPGAVGETISRVPKQGRAERDKHALPKLLTILNTMAHTGERWSIDYAFAVLTTA